MARAGMTRWRQSRSSIPDSDEVQRSLELLDKVLSEFDDLENGNVDEEGPGFDSESGSSDSLAVPKPVPPDPQAKTPGNVSSTPDDESPSLGGGVESSGHQSEDDGYMSMNGRRAKFVLSFRNVATPQTVPDEEAATETTSGHSSPPEGDLPPPPEISPADYEGVAWSEDIPPPPEEAERIISTLLPRVSPGNSEKRSSVRRGNCDRKGLPTAALTPELDSEECRVTTATQTPMANAQPNARHARPSKRDTSNPSIPPPFFLQQPPSPPLRFGSLPYDVGTGNYHYAQFPAEPTNPPPWKPTDRQRPPLLHKSVAVLTSPEAHFAPPWMQRYQSFPEMSYLPTVVTPPRGFSFDEYLIPGQPDVQRSANRMGQYPQQRYHTAPAMRYEQDRETEWNGKRGPLPPRTIPGFLERHREVKRCGSDGSTSVDSLQDAMSSSRTGRSGPDDVGCGEELYPAPHLLTLTEFTDDDIATFSDDSLEDDQKDGTASKRASIAWEVPLGDPHATLEEVAAANQRKGDVPKSRSERSLKDLSPGSTKVIGRRPRRTHSSEKTAIRRRSSDRAQSTGRQSKSRHESESREDGISSRHIPKSSSASCIKSVLEDRSRKSDEFSIPEIPLDMQNGVPNGTYVIRRGRKKERAPMVPKEKSKERQIEAKKEAVSVIVNGKQKAEPEVKQRNGATKGKQESQKISRPSRPISLKRSTSNFESLKALIQEGCLEGLNEAPPDFEPPTPPTIVRVVSLPALLMSTMEDTTDGRYLPPRDDDTSWRIDNHYKKTENGSKMSPSNATEAERRSSKDKKKFVESRALEEVVEEGPWLCAGEISEVKVVPVVVHKEENSPQRERYPSTTDEESDSRAEEDGYKVTVEVELPPPLPPQDYDIDEPVMVRREDKFSDYAEIFQASPLATPHLSNGPTANYEPLYRNLDIRPDSPPLFDAREQRSSKHRHAEPPPSSQKHYDPGSSLKTRSMDAGLSKGHRHRESGSRKHQELPPERRTLPTELQGPSRRRAFQKRPAPFQSEEFPTSSSLPETPIFARGCDIPRTPHRKVPDIPGIRTAPRPGGLAGPVSVSPYPGTQYNYRKTGGVLRPSLSEGGEMRIGGPGRGWYPRHRQPRPASIENLDRVPSGWDGREPRKPLTLPPNLTPKFFHRSPREALRRVTSLLIRRGSSKDPKKEVLSPTGTAGEAAEPNRSKRGFFRNFWKRSRHYSLEHQ